MSNAKVRWFSPHPSICCFEILHIDEANGFLTRNKRKIIHFEESRPEEELRELKKIGINSALLSIEEAPAKKGLPNGAGPVSESESLANTANEKRNGHCTGMENNQTII